ncbi:hypothetical protein [Phormidium sp. FACHB-1136]|uniref:hypothetical protein n=1 Tax=Phormidium sp. FACHB-1136 TaxID=2692848 RepID=UPI00168613DB|nr:hypothetical protein [Phormidium sp. FACHB-1136]MBD2426608.1 hypothetical protein [Phormidium sp. FACHB-1136]
MENSLLSSAKNGDVKAIESLINSSLKSKKMVARVTHAGSVLRVRVRSEIKIDQLMADYIFKGIGKIQPKGFKKLIVESETLGGDTTWSLSLELDSGNIQTLPSEKKRSHDVKILTFIGLSALACLTLFLWLGFSLFFWNSGFFSDPGKEHWINSEEKMKIGLEYLNSGNLPMTAEAIDEAMIELEKIPENSSYYDDAVGWIEYFNNFLADIHAWELEQSYAMAGKLKEGLRSSDPDAMFFSDVRVDSNDDSEFKSLVLEVTTAWDYQTREVQNRVATEIWSIWAEARTPEDTSQASLKIVTTDGRVVGGYTPGNGVYLNNPNPNFSSPAVNPSSQSVNPSSQIEADLQNYDFAIAQAMAQSRAETSRLILEMYGEMGRNRSQPYYTGGGSIFNSLDPCNYPWQTDSLGRSCGGRAASEREGGQ